MFPILPGSNPSGYNLTRSLRFRRNATAALSRTPATSTNRKTFTFSVWLKRGDLATTQGIFGAGYFLSGIQITSINFLSDSTILVDAGIYGISTNFSAKTTAVFRDPSAWYHIVLAIDTTQATASNRLKLYVNNVLQTLVSNAGGSIYPTQNYDTAINLNSFHDISWTGANAPIDGYMAEVNFIDGQALTPSSFGSTNLLTGVWQPARYAGTYGTNGFYLPFTDNSALTTSSNVGLGRDYSGNGNFWATTNISITAGVTYDSMTDVPTLTNATTANYAVLNPLDAPSGANIASGNLNATNLSTVWLSRVSTVHVNSGKYYAEVLGFTAAPFMFGVVGSNWRANIADSRFWVDATGKGYYSADGNKYTNGSGAAYGATYTFGDIIGIALDLDSGTLEFYKNGVSQGVAFSGLSGGFQFAVACNANNSSLAINFGQRPFTYTPPTGFVALNTFNLPNSTIVKGNTVFDAALWTGNGASPRTVVNSLNFDPDFVWVKSRSNSGWWHQLSNKVAGIGNIISTNNADAEVAQGSNVAGYISSTNSTGFAVTAGSSSVGSYNANGDTYVAWQWNAGGSTVTNTSGTISSQVRANPSSGFSVVTYTGTGANATVGHGLGVAPKMIIVKNRSTSIRFWTVYHQSLGNTNYLVLNATDASASSSLAWNNTSPSSSVFSIGAGNTVNSSDNYVAYCWSEIDGYSKFGSYTGNGSADGTFVYLGFRPKFVVVKRTDAANNWHMTDSVRDPTNVCQYLLRSNTSDAESTFAMMDFTSNGIKFRTSDAGWNASGGTYIYMAFAENPFKNALAR